MANLYKFSEKPGTTRVVNLDLITDIRLDGHGIQLCFVGGARLIFLKEEKQGCYYELAEYIEGLPDLIEKEPSFLPEV